MALPLRQRCLAGLTSQPGVRLKCSCAQAYVGGDRCVVGWCSVALGAEARRHALSGGVGEREAWTRAGFGRRAGLAALDETRRTRRRRRWRRRGPCCTANLRALMRLGVQASAATSPRQREARAGRLDGVRVTQSPRRRCALPQLRERVARAREASRARPERRSASAGPPSTFSREWAESRARRARSDRLGHLLPESTWTDQVRCAESSCDVCAARFRAEQRRTIWGCIWG